MSNAIAIIRDPDRAASILSPLRRRILEALREPGSATSVAEGLGLPRQKVNYHVRALQDAGLLVHVEDRLKGNCTEHVVRSTARHYLISPDVIGDLAPTRADIQDRHSSANLAAVAARTVAEVAELRDRAAAAKKRLATYSLESAVRLRSPADQAAFIQEMTEAVLGVVAKYNDQTADAGRWFRVALGAHPALHDPAKGSGARPTPQSTTHGTNSPPRKPPREIDDHD